MIMTEKLPIITVTCYRDLELLELQAQSINLYLDKNCPVWLVVNEQDTVKWFDQFDKNIRHYYDNHELNILTLDDFEGEWNHWIPSLVNPWAVGWETQQVLKLAIASKIKAKSYLVLDSQNLLFKEWGPNKYFVDHRVPCRSGTFVMPLEIWNDYSKSLDITIDLPDSNSVSMCTPIFFNTELVSSLIEETGGVLKFTSWFKNASKIKSEFILYVLWAEKQGGLDKFHNMIPVPEDWASPYLRDCKTEQEFEDFISFIGVHAPHSWISVNHRAWGNMTAEQYQRLLTKLETYNLFPKFDEYRSNYIDLKF